ncbi:hypothetical protein HMPREF9397_1863 [Streptococcus sanguinis SK1087]|uniref:Uncharacterized protein n=1 Tax=Streptococcus sanguinis SK1087 TaxID=888824 RepID=F3SL41_STRSA|nr:hypothetical protein HMPREF9398_0042 [Streptococcus sanguinis VMC66]EGG39215.1 hypothetical protein HMPREF9397_1863 [Streptococcus sanguinis SK1087]
MRNVSTKYLQDYIGFFTYIRNWRTEHGIIPLLKKMQNLSLFRF